jgi:hypothetical protein
VNDESERLEHIIGDLLEIWRRLEGGGGHPQDGAVADRPVDAARASSPRTVVAEKSISLETVEDPSVPTIHGDQNRLEQALQNLVANAVRHTPSWRPGDRAIRSAPRRSRRVRRRRHGTGDSGGTPGARVRLASTKWTNRAGGTLLPSGSGLGLSIVRAIVTRHGGTVSVSNVDDGGARFEILAAPIYGTFSRRTIALTVPPGSRARPRPTSPSSPGGFRRVAARTTQGLVEGEALERGNLDTQVHRAPARSPRDDRAIRMGSRLEVPAFVRMRLGRSDNRISEPPRL